jgi:hypothetical protein
MGFIAADTATADELREPPGQVGDPCRFAILLDPGDGGGCVGRQGRDGLHQEPRELLGRG